MSEPKYKTLNLPADTHTLLKEMADKKGMKLYRFVEEMMQDYIRLSVMRRD